LFVSGGIAAGEYAEKFQCWRRAAVFVARAHHTHATFTQLFDDEVVSNFWAIMAAAYPESGT
jgi:hypothetical protein